MLRPRGAGAAVPRLDGLPVVAPVVTGAQRRARLALAMLDARVAPPELWNGDAGRFIQDAFETWVARHGGAEVDRRFRLRAYLDSTIEGAYREQELDGVYLCVESIEAGYLEVGRAITRLAKVHPRLPATVYGAIRGLNRCVRVYDYGEVEEYLINVEDGVDDEELGDWRATHALRVPDSLRERPLSWPAVWALADGWPPKARTIAAAARALADRTRDFGEFPQLGEAREAFYNMGQCLPALLVAFKPHDLISATFDEEMQFAFDTHPEPSIAWDLSALTPDAVGRAFRQFAAFLQVLAAYTRLADLLVGKSRWAYATERPSRTLVEVFAAERRAVSEARVLIAGGV